MESHGSAEGSRWRRTAGARRAGSAPSRRAPAPSGRPRSRRMRRDFQVLERGAEDGALAAAGRPVDVEGEREQRLRQELGHPAALGLATRKRRREGRRDGGCRVVRRHRARNLRGWFFSPFAPLPPSPHSPTPTPPFTPAAAAGRACASTCRRRWARRRRDEVGRRDARIGGAARGGPRGIRSRSSRTIVTIANRVRGPRILPPPAPPSLQLVFLHLQVWLVVAPADDGEPVGASFQHAHSSLHLDHLRDALGPRRVDRQVHKAFGDAGTGLPPPARNMCRRRW